MSKDKVYSYEYDSNQVGNPSKKSDLVHAYNVRTGKCQATIDATAIRNRVLQLKGNQTEDAFPVTDQKIKLSVSGKNLYAAYMSGFYKYSKKRKKWQLLLNGTDNKSFSMKEEREFVDFFVRLERKIYVLACKGNYEGEATEFYRYSN